jgi:hypothetical protein
LPEIAHFINRFKEGDYVKVVIPHEKVAESCHVIFGPYALAILILFLGDVGSGQGGMEGFAWW